MSAICDPFFSQVQSQLDDYEKAVDDFLSGPFSKAHTDALVSRWSEQIRQYVVEADGRKGAPTLA
jgi:hypothetical protein